MVHAGGWRGWLAWLVMAAAWREPPHIGLTAPPGPLPSHHKTPQQTPGRTTHRELSPHKWFQQGSAAHKQAAWLVA